MDKTAKFLQVANKALTHAKILPFSQLLTAELKPDLDTWAVSYTMDSRGESKHTKILLIGEKTIDLFPLELIPAIATHEAAHTVFTCFRPNGMYLNDGLMAHLGNVFEDGRINSCLRKTYPQFADKFSQIYAKLGEDDPKSSDPYVFEPKDGENPNSEEIKQIEWVNRASQLMIRENGTPGSGRVLVSDPNWARTKEEKMFFQQTIRFYDGYVGVEPKPLWSGAFNKALHAKALHYLFKFDEFCGDVFNLPERKMPSQAELLKLAETAKESLPKAIERMKPPGVSKLSETEKGRIRKLEEDLKTATSSIENKTGTHRDYGICLAIIGLAKDKTSIELQYNSGETLDTWLTKAKSKTNEWLLQDLPLEDRRIFQHVEECLKINNYDELFKTVKDRKKENLEFKPADAQGKKYQKQEEQVLDYLLRGRSLVEGLKLDRAMRLEDDEPSESEHNQGQGSGQGQSGQGQGAEQESGQGEGQSGQGQSGQGQGQGEGQSPQAGQGQGGGKPDGKGKGQGQEKGFGIGHGGQSPEMDNPMPDFKPAESITPDQVPYWIDSGHVPRKNEPEVLTRKPKQPGLSKGTNGTIDIDRQKVSEYKEMIRREFLTAVMIGEEKPVREKSSKRGRLSARDFIRNDITDGNQGRQMFRSTQYVLGTSSSKGEEMAPELVVVLNDFSGSMHACSKELGAFSGAMQLLCDEKDTRMVLGLGSSEKAFFDTASPENSIFGEEGIIDAIEEKFNLDNGGNSPTWHPNTTKNVDQVLSEYSGREHKIRIIVGSDECILEKEKQWINKLKEQYPTVVVSVQPSANLIREMGSFLRAPDTKPSLVVHDIGI